MRTVLILVGALVGLLGAAGAGFVLAFRTKFEPVLTRVRRMNRRFANPRQLDTAGEVGAYASVVEHVGRTSGTAYRTPVTVQGDGDDLVVALVYGPDTDWVRNLLHAGRATIHHEGEIVTVVDPEVVGADVAAAAFSASDQRTQSLFGVDDYLVMHREH